MDIQLGSQASPDLYAFRDLADYDLWVRGQFPASPDVSVFPARLIQGPYQAPPVQIQPAGPAYTMMNCGFPP